MNNQILYLVIDVYPHTKSETFRTFCGAVVGCWIRIDICGYGATASDVAAERISDAGWHVARVLSREEVSSTTYIDKPESREFFQQACGDGFAAHFHVSSRVTIGSGDLSDDEVVEALIELPGEFDLQKVTSLYSHHDSQWANGVIGDKGDNFVPLWLTPESASAWLQGWPGYRPRHICEVKGDPGFFEQINEANMWIGMGIKESLITMCHPIWIRDMKQ